jgi:hypothetical protein
MLHGQFLTAQVPDLTQETKIRFQPADEDWRTEVSDLQ